MKLYFDSLFCSQRYFSCTPELVWHLYLYLYLYMYR